MSRGIRWKNSFPKNELKKALNNAAEATAYSIAFDLKEYMQERFAEEKTGLEYWIGDGGHWWFLGHQPDGAQGFYHRASAPGEYPAIKYGILNNSLKYRRVQKDDNGVVVEFGAGRQFGSSHGKVNDPFYALDLDQGHTNAPRPYFARAVIETDGQRSAKAPGVFIQHWNRLSTIIGSAGGTPEGSGDQPPGSQPDL